MSKPAKLPWYMKHHPKATTVSCATVDLEDHMGHESVLVTKWQNGEGFDLVISPDKGPETRMPLTWQEWGAAKHAVRAMKQQEKQIDHRG
jgi:hypothetical protein